MSFPGISGGSERRTHDRHPVRTGAVLILPGGRTIQARTLDLGKGGAGLVTDFAIPIDTAVTVRMNLPARPGGSAVFEAKGTVANCSLAGSVGGFRVGLQFGALEPSAIAALGGALP